MKKNLFQFLTLVVLAGISCGNPENKGGDVEETIAEKPVEPSSPAIVDPDPSDTIPGDQYLVHASSLKTADLVRLTLQSELKTDLEKGLVDSLSRQFVFFEYDLNEDGKNEIFVGLFGSYFCGSGGCTQYLLDNQGNIITRFTVSDFPVVIDNNKSNGWKNLVIPSAGKNHIIKFDGKKYPSNPSTQPVMKEIPGDGLPRAMNIMSDKYPRFRF